MQYKGAGIDEIDDIDELLLLEVPNGERDIDWQLLSLKQKLGKTDAQLIETVLQNELNLNPMFGPTEDFASHRLRHQTEKREIQNYLIKEYQDSLTSITETQNFVLEKLDGWKVGQQRAKNGVSLNSSFLDTLQKWFEKLYDIISLLIQQVYLLKEDLNATQMPDGEQQPAMDQLKNICDMTLQVLFSLAKNCLVVEEQSDQVLKYNTSSESTVRLLIPQFLNEHMVDSIPKTVFEEPEGLSVTPVEGPSSDPDSDCLTKKPKFRPDNQMGYDSLCLEVPIKSSQEDESEEDSGTEIPQEIEDQFKELKLTE